MKRKYLISKLNTMAILLSTESPLLADWCKSVVKALMIEESIPNVLERRNVSILNHIGNIPDDFTTWCNRTSAENHPLRVNIGLLGQIKPVQTFMRKHPELI